MDITIQTIILTFVAGVLTFLAPCTLPLIPAYLALITGVPLKQLRQRHAGSDDQSSSHVQMQVRTFTSGLLFVLGFTLVFISLGITAAFIGDQLASYKIILTRIGGVGVILAGLALLGVLRISFFQKEFRAHIKSSSMQKFARIPIQVKAFALGIVFALGWTPCTGPILGAVLLLASTRATVLSGGLLLVIFAAGFAIPFLVVAATIARSTRLIATLGKFSAITSKIAGAALLILGIFMLTNNMGYLISTVFYYLRFLGYEKILNFL